MKVCVETPDLYFTIEMETVPERGDIVTLGGACLGKVHKRYLTFTPAADERDLPKDYHWRVVIAKGGVDGC